MLPGQCSIGLFTDKYRITLHRNDGISVAGDGEMNDTLRSTWSPVEDVQQSGQASPVNTKPIIIIQPIITPEFHQHTPNFLFMDDNAPPHCTGIVTARIQEIRVSHMVWPAMTPDLNSIEYMDKLKQRLNDHTPPQSDLLNCSKMLF
uniref:Tc1-like transposase DDE domain-containing protein n=1 Tax=Oryzias sinensis TaxID=183150 RepID=A0A8C8DUF1_9TELE